MRQKRLVFRIGCFEGKTEIETDDLSELDNLMDIPYNAFIYSDSYCEKSYTSMKGVPREMVSGIIKNLFSAQEENTAMISPSKGDFNI